MAVEGNASSSPRGSHAIAASNGGADAEGEAHKIVPVILTAICDKGNLRRRSRDSRAIAKFIKRR